MKLTMVTINYVGEGASKALYKRCKRRYDELMNIINGLSIEDKAAVTKYAKSMADDSEGAEDPMMGGEMRMESKRGMKNIIDEVLNDVLDNKEGTKRPEKKMPRQYRDMEMPFKSPF